MGCEPLEELEQRLQRTLDRQRNAEIGLAETSAALEKVQKEKKQLQAEKELLKNALSPFVSFKQFIDALRETQKEKPLTEYSCIVSLMGSGASDYIWYGDLIKAEQALKDKG